MTFIDWSIVLVLNGSIIFYAMLRGRETHNSRDWFLAGRSLPWWIVGISMYATAIDSTDLVVDAGAAYGLGLRYFVANWMGVVGGWLLLAHVVAPQMYRAGMYTNAEYLEARFGVASRVISVLVQVIYRTSIIGMIATTNYLTLHIACGMTPVAAWSTVVSIAVLATAYTMIGGLKSVAITDALQSIIMLLASIVFFVVVWGQVDGWEGTKQKLAAADAALPEQFLRIGVDQQVVEKPEDAPSEPRIAIRQRMGFKYDEQRDEFVRTSPAWLVCLSLMIAGVSYSLVNHTQSMRLLGARSVWDIRMAAVPAGLILIGVTFLNLTMGIMGRALYPVLDANLLGVDQSVLQIDVIYPVMVREFCSTGLRGIVVAGIFAAAFSTYDSIGSTLSALITRDVYARLLVTDRSDGHYLAVARWLTPVVVFGSFLYVPELMSRGMISFYLELVGSFVVPLMAVYLLGSFSRAHRSSAVFGLAAGVAYGIVALCAPRVADSWDVVLLPPALMDANTTAPITFAITCSVMVLVSLVRGWETSRTFERTETGRWLADSQQEAREASPPDESRSNTLPVVLGLIVITISTVLCFGVFW